MRNRVAAPTPPPRRSLLISSPENESLPEHKISREFIYMAFLYVLEA